MSRPDELRQPPRRHSDARLRFFRAAERTTALLGGRAFYRRRFLRSGRLVAREERVRVPGLAPELEGFTLAHLSDFHAGPFMGPGDLAAAVALVNARGVDACALTGDFITHRWHDARALVEDLARLESRHGSFAVFGNHDYRGREEGRIAETLAGAGVRFLRNASARLASEAPGVTGVALVGVEDLEEAKLVDLEAARRVVRAGDVEILLSHNPSGAPALARTGCRVILSGHTHGKQIDVPHLEGPGPRHPGLRVELGATTLIVSRGLGVVGIPVRFRAPAEVVFVVLEAGDAR